jgi:hypothetical protein
VLKDPQYVAQYHASGANLANPIVRVRDDADLMARIDALVDSPVAAGR